MTIRQEFIRAFRWAYGTTIKGAAHAYNNYLKDSRDRDMFELIRLYDFNRMINAKYDDDYTMEE